MSRKPPNASAEAMLAEMVRGIGFTNPLPAVVLTAEERRAIREGDTEALGPFRERLIESLTTMYGLPAAGMQPHHHAWETKRKIAHGLLDRVWPQTVRVDLFAEVRSMSDRELLETARILDVVPEGAARREGDDA